MPVFSWVLQNQHILGGVLYKGSPWLNDLENTAYTEFLQVIYKYNIYKYNHLQNLLGK